MLGSNRQRFLLLTAQDLPTLDSYAVETDSFTDNEIYQQINTDCACPDDGFVFASEAGEVGESTSYILPALHTDELAEGFVLAFNPLGEAGVVVLDQSAFALLNAFGEPRSLADGAAAVGEPVEGLKVARRLAKLGLLEPVGRRKQPTQAQAQTLTAWLHVTNQCNLRCSYCYLHKTPDQMELERGLESVEAVFRSAVANGFRRVKLKYAGGESTLNFPLVLALHDHAELLAAQYGLELSGVVLSNGVAWSERMIEALNSRGLQLMISLDGIGEVHNTQRYFINGRGSWSHVERTLDRLASHHVRPSISITLSNRNLKGLPQTVDYLLERNLPFALNFYRENDCSASFKDLSYQEEQIIAAMRAAFAVIESNLPAYSLLNALVDRARLDTPHNRPCGAGDSYLVIDQYGGVAKCQMEIEQTITDISVADPLRIIRDDQSGILNVPVEEKEGCRECSWRYWCAGGCPALTYRMTGRFDVKSPNCRIYKTLFPEVLRLEGQRLLKYSGVLAS